MSCNGIKYEHKLEHLYTYIDSLQILYVFKQTSQSTTQQYYVYRVQGLSTVNKDLGHFYPR